jgi:hypothetical protein
MNDIPVPGKFEVHDTNGKIVGSISAEELARLREENEVLQRQMMSLLPVATPEEEAEMEAALATAVDLNMDEIIRDIETSEGR